MNDAATIDPFEWGFEVKLDRHTVLGQELTLYLMCVWRTLLTLNWTVTRHSKWKIGLSSLTTSARYHTVSLIFARLPPAFCTCTLPDCATMGPSVCVCGTAGKGERERARERKRESARERESEKKRDAAI